MKPPGIKQTFKKHERLRSSKMIRLLFAHGNTFLIHPFRVNWLIGKQKGLSPASVMIGVSRKSFRNASDRNHLKRLCREAYRRNKHSLYKHLEEHELSCNFSIVYIGKSKADYSVIEKKIIILIQRLISELEIYSHQNKTRS
ncbi:MAG: ribonuclease P protein component [Bacteroidales bacterium]|nr:ribonuclease P protein component [Bacteroidales bacterium]